MRWERGMTEVTEKNDFDVFWQKYNFVKNRAFIISLSLSYYRKIFLDKSKIHILEKTAPNFFVRLRVILYDEIIQNLSNMFDDAVSKIDKKNENISIKNLFESSKKLSILETQDVKTISEIISNLDEFKKKIINYRNKYLAHYDFDFLLNKPSKEKLPDIDEYDTVLKSIISILNFFEMKKSKSELHHEVIDSAGANALISHLDVAIHHLELEKKKIIPPEHWYRRSR
jgi:AbiU2